MAIHSQWLQPVIGVASILLGPTSSTVIKRISRRSCHSPGGSYAVPQFISLFGDPETGWPQTRDDPFGRFKLVAGCELRNFAEMAVEHGSLVHVLWSGFESSNYALRAIPSHRDIRSLRRSDSTPVTVGKWLSPTADTERLCLCNYVRLARGALLVA
ncbi:hypothetical protein MRX96_029957 [Rhipicephalus microplus]